MKGTLVTRDQFNVSPQGIIHKPTDAAFTPTSAIPFGDSAVRYARQRAFQWEWL
jgi:hypothetical protein